MGFVLVAATACGIFAASVPARGTGPEGGPNAQRVLGRWLRPDGGYVLELWEIRDGGALEARYFNPRPIHVGRAEIGEQGGSISVFVELRDVNYPGSTYTLQYDPRTDRLTGSYFQAVIGETFEVEFVRLQ